MSLKYEEVFANMKSNGPAFDELVIFFKREAYYEDPDVFWAEVRQSPLPLPSGVFRVNIEQQGAAFQRLFTEHVRLNHLFYDASEPRDVAEQAALDDLVELGHGLYGLLPEALRQAFLRLLQHVFERGRFLRIVFEAEAGNQADRLLTLPWEIMALNEKAIYPARSQRVVVVRRLLGAVRRSPVRLDPPLNVVHVIAHIPGEEGPAKIAASLQQAEREAIGQAIVPGEYRLVPGKGSIEGMQAVLKTGPYHIVHFLGHGETAGPNPQGASSPPTTRAYLRFVSEEGRLQWVSGEHLQHLLSETPAAQLVVLNACRGGSTIAGNIALEVVYNGLPYVVAMQADILQEAAKHFIQAFYSALQENKPVEVAVAAGRAAIAAAMPGSVDWCLPVLYTGVGLPEEGLPRAASERVWHWFGHEGRQQIAFGTLTFGAVSLFVGLLLLLSQAAPALPTVRVVGRVTGGLALLPLLLSMFVSQDRRLAAPTGWLLPARAALMLRVAGAASIGFGFSMLGMWLGLMLVASLGFWELLTPSVLAQVLLLCPAVGVSLLAGYALAVGMGRAFIDNAKIQHPRFDLGESVFVIAGYIFLLLPLAGLYFLPSWVAPPWGNIVLGMGGVGMGWVFYRSLSDL
jgi:hypothetical protein